MFDLDVSQDFEVFDWEGPIQYSSKIADGNPPTYANPVPISYCLHREESKTVAGFFGGDLIQKFTRWEIWVANAPNNSFRPQRGDLIQDSDNNTWVVEKYDYCDKISRWRLYCLEKNQGKGN